MRAILEDVAREDPEFKYSLQRTMVYEAAEIPPDAPLAKIISRHLAEVTGVSSEPCGMIASTDVRNFIIDAGIPAVNFGPGSLKEAHSFNESVSIQELVDCVEILARTAAELLR